MIKRWGVGVCALVAGVMMSGCGPEAGVRGPDAVTGFEAARYMGKWYEIARLENRFQRGLTEISAEYTLRDDGSVKVLNRGFAKAKGKWKEAEGKAVFVGDPEEADLKVSFFGPFFGGYRVFGLDQKGYQWAYITGPGRKYLWLLARTPQLSEARKKHFVETAKALGYDTDALVWVEHGVNAPPAQ